MICLSLGMFYGAIMEWSEGIHDHIYFLLAHCIFHATTIPFVSLGIYISDKHAIYCVTVSHHRAPATQSQEKRNQQTL